MNLNIGTTVRLSADQCGNIYVYVILMLFICVSFVNETKVLLFVKSGRLRKFYVILETLQPWRFISYRVLPVTHNCYNLLIGFDYLVSLLLILTKNLDVPLYKTIFVNFLFHYFFGAVGYCTPTNKILIWKKNGFEKNNCEMWDFFW